MGAARPSSTVGRLQTGAALAIVGLILAAIIPAASAAQRQPGDRDCSLASSGAVPLIDLGSDTYMGAQGGLYPKGSNEIPASHLALGLERAGAITPVDESGEPDPSGKIALVSIGVSNTAREFGAFQAVVAAAPGIDPSMVFVNAAQGGQDLTIWADPTARPWEGLDSALAEGGVTPAQVQVAWVKLVDRVDEGAPPPFPDHATNYRERLATVLRTLQDALPNLQIAYLSSRVYGGYNDVSSPSPEPTAYEEGFGVKWTIERQMAGDPELNADPTSGPVEAPWIAWGPYMWADGTAPRSDGLTWECGDFRGDGVHPEGTGNEKVAGLLLDFFETEPTAAWMFSDHELPPTPEVTDESVPTSTIGPPPAVGTEPPQPEDTSTDTTARQGDDDDPGSTDTDVVETRPSTSAVDGAATPGDRGESEQRGVPPFVWLVLAAAVALALIAAGVAVGRRGNDRPDDTG